MLLPEVVRICPNLSSEYPQGTSQSRRSAANQRVPSRLPLERSAVSQDTSDVIMISGDDAIGREVYEVPRRCLSLGRSPNLILYQQEALEKYILACTPQIFLSYYSLIDRILYSLQKSIIE